MQLMISTVNVLGFTLVTFPLYAFYSFSRGYLFDLVSKMTLKQQPLKLKRSNESSSRSLCASCALILFSCLILRCPCASFSLQPDHEQQGYYAMMKEKEHLEEERKALQDQFEATSQKLRKTEADLASNPAFARIADLRQQKDALQQTSDELDQALGLLGGADVSQDPSVAELAIGPDDDKETIKQKVRASNAKIKEYEGQIQREERNIERLQQELMDVGIQETAQESKEENEKRLQEMRDSEREIDSLLASYEASKAQLEGQKSEQQQLIVDLLLHIAQGLKHQSDIITPEQALQLQSDLEFKKDQTQSAIATKERLAQGLPSLTRCYSPHRSPPPLSHSPMQKKPSWRATTRRSGRGSRTTKAS
jgi:hypothetical protein